LALAILGADRVNNRAFSYPNKYSARDVQQIISGTSIYLATEYDGRTGLAWKFNAGIGSDATVARQN
jgi:hypothetical protein